MKLTRKRKVRSLKFDPTVLPEYKSRVKKAIRHLRKKAKPGVPYAILNLLHELDKNRIVDITTDDGMKCAALAVDILVNQLNWYKIGEHYYGINGKASLRDMVDGCTGCGFDFSIGGRVKTVGRFASPPQTKNTMSKAVNRLVADGRFVRLERGRYKRVHVGM